MSIEIPIYEDRILGSEYQMIQQDSRNRGLQKPLKKNPMIDNSNNEYSIDFGLNNPTILLQNNDNPSETQIFTDAQALLNIQRNGSLDKSMSIEERELINFVGNDLNANLRLKLVNESDVSGDNIYSQQSQDFVNQLRNDIESYVYENNLYLQNVPPQYIDTPLERAMLKGDQVQEPTISGALLDIVNKLNKDDAEKVKQAFAERKRFVPPSGPRQEEKLERDVKKDKFKKREERREGIIKEEQPRVRGIGGEILRERIQEQKPTRPRPRRFRAGQKKQIKTKKPKDEL